MNHVGCFSLSASDISLLHHSYIILVFLLFPPAGYWASYNVPFHADIYNLSGYGVMWRKHGEDFSYDLCPRAKIFRRDQARVTGLASLKHIMRYNSECCSPSQDGADRWSPRLSRPDLRDPFYSLFWLDQGVTRVGTLVFAFLCWPGMVPNQRQLYRCL